LWLGQADPAILRIWVRAVEYGDVPENSNRLTLRLPLNPLNQFHLSTLVFDFKESDFDQFVAIQSFVY